MPTSLAYRYQLCMVVFNHRLPLSKSALPNVQDKNPPASIAQSLRAVPSDRPIAPLLVRMCQKASGKVLQLSCLLRNLVWVNIELLIKFGQRAFS
jgi:hypothetical protein